MTARRALVLKNGNVSQIPAGDVLTLPASTTAAASLNVPHGTAPTSPTDGDFWATAAGAFIRINGVTKGPFGAGAAVTVSTSAPSSPAAGDLWWKSDEGRLKVYYTDSDSSQWVDANPTVPGPQGEVGGQGPAPWIAPAAWVTATAYTATAPASAVSQGGSSYACLISHTSGTFATDLAAGKWGLIASKGDTGASGATGLFGSQLSATPTQSDTGLSTLVGTGAASADTAAGQRITSTSAGMAAKSAAPATPYTVTALLAGNAGANALGFTDGTKYQFVYANPSPSGYGILNVQANPTLNTFNSTTATFSSGFNARLIWLRISDDGTNVAFAASADGVNFTTVTSFAKSGGYLGGSGYSSIFVGSPGGSGAQDVTIMSWAIA